MHNYDKPGAKTVVPRVNNEPHDVETTIRGASDARGGSMPSTDHNYFHKSTIPPNRTKMLIPRVDTAPHGVETPTAGTPYCLLRYVKRAISTPLEQERSASSFIMM